MSTFAEPEVLLRRLRQRWLRIGGMAPASLMLSIHRCSVADLSRTRQGDAQHRWCSAPHGPTRSKGRGSLTQAIGVSQTDTGTQASWVQNSSLDCSRWVKSLSPCPCTRDERHCEIWCSAHRLDS